MCADPYDYHYTAMGGVVDRSDRVNGRVGSVFGDAGYSSVGGSDGEYLDSAEPFDIESYEYNESGYLDGEVFEGEVTESVPYDAYYGDGSDDMGTFDLNSESGVTDNSNGVELDADANSFDGTIGSESFGELPSPAEPQPAN